MTGLVVRDGFTPLSEALERLDVAVSPVAGIVTGLMAGTYLPDESSLPNSACELASARRTLGNPTVSVGSGAHPDPGAARAAAIGEAVERYAGAYLPTDRIRCTTAGVLGSSAVDPEQFALFHTRQHSLADFPFVRFTAETTTTFVEGVALSDGSPAFLPAELVFLSRPQPELPPIGYATSSGLACGASLAEAVLGGLLELVERDAVMLAWKCRLALPLLDWSAEEELAKLECAYFRGAGAQIQVIDASCLLGVPVAISVLRGGPGSGAGVAVGAAAAPEIGSAWLKAVSESCGVYRWLRHQWRAGADVPATASDVESFDDHMLFYATDERAAQTRFLDSSLERRRTSSCGSIEGSTPREQIRAILAKLARRGVSVYAVDVTTPDVRTLGLSVVRVIAPELCALDVSHRAQFCGGDRLYSAPKAAGVSPTELTFDDLNPLPHPFP